MKATVLAESSNLLSFFIIIWHSSDDYEQQPGRCRSISFLLTYFYQVLSINISRQKFLPGQDLNLASLVFRQLSYHCTIQNQISGHLFLLFCWDKAGSPAITAICVNADEMPIIIKYAAYQQAHGLKEDNLYFFLMFM